MLTTIAAAHRAFAREFRRHDPVLLARSFAGLLLDPELQRNNLRIEALVHLAMAWGRGTAAPTVSEIRQAFTAMDKGPCGYLEDPPEDLFVELIRTPFGQFRVLAGSWESAGYYVQRIVDVVEMLPDGPGYREIAEACTALLKLSDAICDRAGLHRYRIGGEAYRAGLTVDLAIRGRKAADHLRFSIADLDALGIDPAVLEPFVHTQPTSELLFGDFGRTALERHPLVRTEGGLVVMMPTAISVALRFFVIETLQAAGHGEALAGALAQAHLGSFERNRVLGGQRLKGLPFQKVEGALIGSAVREVEPGRVMQTILVIDDLAGFSETGLTEPTPNADSVLEAINQHRREGMSQGSDRPGFREGLVLVVLGGVGRAAVVGFEALEDSRWDIRIISAPDIDTLDSLDRVSALTLFRVSRAETLIEAMGAELHNINGFLNLVGWMRQLDGHLIPHGSMDDGLLDGDAALLIWVDQTAIRTLREEAARTWDRHLQLDIDRNWIPVQRSPPSLFLEDQTKPHYFSETFPPRGIFLTSKRAWWCTSETRPGTSARMAYERWRVVDLWLSRAAPILDRAFQDLAPGPIEWVAAFQAELTDRSGEQAPMPLEEARGLVEASAERARNRITTTCRPEWERGHAQEENIAERALVDGLVRAVALLADAALSDAARETIVASIVVSPQARQQHGFRSASYRDMVQASLPNPVIIEREDDATARLGLGWKVRERATGPWVEGKAECVGFLNALVTRLEDDLLLEIRKFNRKALLDALLLNHEAAARDLSQWNITSASVIALHDDQDAAYEAIMEWSARLNAITLTTRILLEIAVCEGLASAGHEPGELDLCRMMTLAAMIFHFGGDSDAIRWDVMEPKLRITPFGDVHANHEFSDTVVVPFSKMNAATRLRAAVADYAVNVREPTEQSSGERPADDFDAALEEAFEAPTVSIPILVEQVEQIGLQRGQPTIKINRSELVKLMVSAGARRAPELLEKLTLAPRESWRITPPRFEPKDRHPWRFRRQLSVLRRPILALDDGADPELLISPGLLREALDYTVANYRNGSFPEQQLGPLMRSWKARTDGRHGDFARDVGAALQAVGWTVEIDVPLTKVAGQKLDRDYGDFDVLAFHAQSSRVLLIECKDLQFRKTFGEVAEQLSDYRGEERRGKRDKLRRHLDRLDVMSRHLDRLQGYVRLRTTPVIEGHLVFRNPVPMTFALDRIRDRTSVLTMSDLDQIAPPI